MTDRHRSRKAKQARRDARRARKRRAGTGSEPPPDDPQQDPTSALSPWSFLVFASQQVEAAKPDPLANFRSHQEDPVDIDYLIKSLVDDPDPGSASVVALFAELLDGELQLRCREALNAYNGPLVPWVTALRDVDVYRAVRLTHVLGDFDQILLGARLLDGQEATCGVLINHLDDSEIADAALLVVTIDDAVDELSGPDFTAADMSLADARTWIEYGLKRTFVFRETATWPDCRPLVQWLVGRLPDGGDLHQSGDVTRAVRCSTSSLRPRPALSSTVATIDTCCRNSRSRARPTHCGGARRAWNRCSTLRCRKAITR